MLESAFMHIGKIIKEELHNKGISVTAFAESLCCNRQNVYKLFNKKDINTDLLFRISIILEFDFFAEISKCVYTRINSRSEQ